MSTSIPGHAQINALFLSRLDAESKDEILRSIADHYGITPQAAYDEVCQTDAEHLLDYMIEPLRGATYVLMQAHGMCLPGAV
jgi:hypothetical protein